MIEESKPNKIGFFRSLARELGWSLLSWSSNIKPDSSVMVMMNEGREVLRIVLSGTPEARRKFRHYFSHQNTSPMEQADEGKE
ncbi:hypothetical protein [Achromobacter phage Motura]|uniref:Uncharacterized protein n=1 Tax=Achromobacter phage Motura TaxID=2591403 RepID=A0A514CSW9_9CAUD|nr:hypothetical protein H1O15_gp223 [Achromobacter phage Motura]QDH83565.1 hypothetical protein [Achromobacter phage Motura]